MRLTKQFFRCIGSILDDFRELFYPYKTLFDILFLIIYTLEQLIMFLLILLLPSYTIIIVEISIILLLFTRSFEKICMDSRYSQYRKDISEIKKEYDRLEWLHIELKKFIKRKFLRMKS